MRRFRAAIRHFFSFSKGPLAIFANWGGAITFVISIVNVFSTWSIGHLDSISQYGLLSVAISGAISANLIVFISLFLWSLKRRHETPGQGGQGGGAEDIHGADVVIVGGRGGAGGPPGAGVGGAGGGARSIRGQKIRVIGGDGGSAGTWDGRGGKPGRSPGEITGLPTELWNVGAGGVGADAEEFERRMKILRSVRDRYCQVFPDQSKYIESGIDIVPINFVNKRLEELNENWNVALDMEKGGYKMPSIY